MSCTELLLVPKEGTLQTITELRNSHGSAPRIWDALAERWMQKRSIILMPESQLESFWALASDEGLSFVERAALACTFDKTICEYDRADDLADALERFDAMFPVCKSISNHLPAIAGILRKRDWHTSRRAGVGFAFIWTSVASDVWNVPDVCRTKFHDAECEGYCPICENEWPDRSFHRMFDWAKDKERKIHQMLFADVLKC